VSPGVRDEVPRVRRDAVAVDEVFRLRRGGSCGVEGRARQARGGSEEREAMNHIPDVTKKVGPELLAVALKELG